LRAPTPSAAAELIVPLKQELVQRTNALSHQLLTNFHKNIDRLRLRVENLDRRLLDPRKKVQNLRLRLDELMGRFTRAMVRQQALRRERLSWRVERLHASAPSIRIPRLKEKLAQMNVTLFLSYKASYNQKTQALREQAAKLHALSPLAILSRGYSITRTVPELTVVRNSHQVHIDQELEILLNKGALRVNVLQKYEKEL
jgi:exodeoxyribonuclease VII large subunit